RVAAQPPQGAELAEAPGEGVEVIAADVENQPAGFAPAAIGRGRERGEVLQPAASEFGFERRILEPVGGFGARLRKRIPGRQQREAPHPGMQQLEPRRRQADADVVPVTIARPAVFRLQVRGGKALGVGVGDGRQGLRHIPDLTTVGGLRKLASHRQRPDAEDMRMPGTKLPTVGTTIFTVMSQLAAEHGAVNLGQGFPDFDVPARLVDAVDRAMRAGHNQYPPMTGVAALREAIADKTAALYGYRPDPDAEVTVTSGATEAIFNAVHAVVRAGDEVVVLDPAYDCYEPAIDLAGGRAVHVPLDPAT